MSFVRSMATVGGWTALSRVLGFVRDILIARVLGTGPAADAFVVAFKLPNLFRRLFGEGAFNAAFVPLFAKRLEGEGAPAAKAFAEEAMAVLAAAVLVVVALAIATMPWLMALLAPGFTDNPEQYELAVWLTRITFPYLLFMALAALLSGVLNSLRRFTAAAAAPVLLNVFFLLSLLAIVPLTGAPAEVLAWTVAAAGVGQFLLVYISAARAGFRLKFQRPRLGPEVKRLWKLMLPGLVAAGATQLNLFVGTLIATLEAGAPSYLYYADRVYQLPLGLIGIAFGVVLLPEISRRLKRHGEEAAINSLNRGLEYSLLLALPATVALVTIPLPICRVLFERGAFGAEASVATALTLLAYASGLPAYVATKVLQPAFFAREDTVTPLKAALWGVAVNLVGAVGLFFLLRPYGLGYLGLAVATSLAAWVTLAILARALLNKRFLVLDQRLKQKAPRQLLAALGMGAVLVLGAELTRPWWNDEGELLPLLTLGLLCVLGLAVFTALVFLLKAASWSELKSLKPNRGGHLTPKGPSGDKPAA